MAGKDVHVGLVGAGIGGLAAAIALRRAGAKVTVLEAAPVLGEIGAGIQMTPNVSRLLRAWGVADVIGDNLVRMEELNMRRRDGTKVGHTLMKRVENTLGQPWWVVHRAHLHEGLVEIAQQSGADVIIDSKVTNLDYQDGEQVNVTTERGKQYTFDLLVGSDGINSIVRKTIMPDVQPKPPTTNCAYRAIVPYDQIRKDPVAKDLIDRLTMEVWMSEKSYIISYPISAGKDFNMVLSHHRPNLVSNVEQVDIQDLRDTYKDYDPRIKRIVDMVPEAQRWPLMVTGPLNTWSTRSRNIVLMGDAAHSMVNHMAQGAATSMEDGAFLAKTIGEAVKGNMTIAEAVELYERERMPKAYAKQQVSFLNGAIWHLPDGPEQRARDEAMSPELSGEQYVRSPNLYGDPATILEVYGYDAEEHARIAIASYLQQREPADPQTGVKKSLEDRYMNWFRPTQEKARL